jgi:hypothetical protein
MTKFLCFSALMAFIVFPSVHAEYRMVVGLEGTSGGSLPKNSIVFTNTGTVPTQPEGDDYSIFGSYAAVARAIVAEKNPVTVMTYENVRDVFNAGYNLNDYRTLQMDGYGYGLLATYVWSTDFTLSNLISLHNEGYNLLTVAQAGNYMFAVYNIPTNIGIHKITESYKASCFPSLVSVFPQIDISQWDAYAGQQNCLK